MGTAFFPSEQFVQLTFQDTDTYEKYLHNLSFTVKDKTYHLSPPKHIPRSSLTIHLHGLPILPKPTINKAIHEALSQYCNVQDIAPVLIKGTELITPKWDAVVTPITDKQIPVHLNILNSSIALTWVNSSKICLRCHSQNHLNSDCPNRPPPRPRMSKTYASLPNTHISPPANNPTQITHTLPDPSNTLQTSNTNTNTTSLSTNNSSYSNLVIINETDSITEHALQEEQMLTAEEDNDSDDSSSTSDMAIDTQHKDNNKNTNSTNSSSLSLSIHAPHGNSPQSDKNNLNVENDNHPYKPASRHPRRSTQKSTN